MSTVFSWNYRTYLKLHLQIQTKWHQCQCQKMTSMSCSLQPAEPLAFTSWGLPACHIRVLMNHHHSIPWVSHIDSWVFISESHKTSFPNLPRVHTQLMTLTTACFELFMPHCQLNQLTLIGCKIRIQKLWIMCYMLHYASGKKYVWAGNCRPDIRFPPFACRKR